MKSVALHNLGCKVNSYEIEVMQQMLQEKGYTIVPFDETADIYIVNTCTVTNIADRKSRQMLHRAKQKNPAALVVAVGCYVQTGREDVEQDPCIDLAIGNNRKKDLASILEEYLRDLEQEYAVAENAENAGHGVDKTLHDTTVIDINHTAEYEEMTLKQTAEHTRAYIKIQDGCNQFLLRYPLCQRQSPQPQGGRYHPGDHRHGTERIPGDRTDRYPYQFLRH